MVCIGKSATVIQSVLKTHKEKTRESVSFLYGGVRSAARTVPPAGVILHTFFLSENVCLSVEPESPENI